MLNNENKYQQQKHDSKLSIRKKIYLSIRTVVDFLIALVAVLILIIPFIIIAIVIKIDSPGPVFFKHKRIGKKGKEYTFLKFRSMSVLAQPDVSPNEFEDVDFYITRVGSFLRKTSLDELPQLLLVLSGKMSIIGYRPAQKIEVELDSERAKLNIYQIKPGITGWAQVNGRDILAATPTKKAKFDCYYVNNVSLWLDIKIFFKTIVIVLRRKDYKEGKIETNILAEQNNNET